MVNIGANAHLIHQNGVYLYHNTTVNVEIHYRVISATNGYTYYDLK